MESDSKNVVLAPSNYFLIKKRISLVSTLNLYEKIFSFWINVANLAIKSCGISLFRNFLLAILIRILPIISFYYELVSSFKVLSNPARKCTALV